MTSGIDIYSRIQKASTVARKHRLPSEGPSRSHRFNYKWHWVRLDIIVVSEAIKYDIIVIAMI
jgi:hypothetical protein